MLNTTLSNRIQTAWESRWSGRMEETLKLLPGLSSELGFQLLGIETSTQEMEWAKDHTTVREALLRTDAILLGASILRLQGKLKDVKSAIERAQNILLGAGLSGSFRFHFERGLLQFVEGYFLTALEDFFAAERMTSDPLLRLLSLSNVMFCMENVGIDHENVLKEINQLRSQLSDSDHPIYLSNEKQLLAYQLRNSFRHGDLKKVKALSGAFEFRVNHQAAFYARYLKLLPYTSFHEPLSKSEIQILLKEPESFYQKGYVIRTLLGNIHANDQETIKISDRIDRLYLWVWMWLSNPEGFGTERLMHALNEVLIHFNPNRVTLEDQALLKNTLGWLRLIDPSILPRVKSVMAQISLASGCFPIFDFESTLIQLLHAKKAGEKTRVKDTLKQLKQHPLWHSDDIQLSDLIKDESHPLTLRVLDAKNAMNVRTESKKMIVDLNTFSIQSFQPEAKIVSEPMAMALQLLMMRESIRCEEFVERVFGFKHYDGFVHLPKINNLISRIKALSRDGLLIKIKAGTITVAVKKQFKVEFVEPAKLTHLLRIQGALKHQPSFEKKGSNKNGLITGILLERFGKGMHFSRDEAQVLLGRSKSTTNRALEKLLQRKVIVKEGYGKSTRYIFLRREMEAA